MSGPTPGRNPPERVRARRSVQNTSTDPGFDLVLAINLLHISPLGALHGLVAGARRVLRPGGRLAIYGPFTEDGRHTSAGNAEFDASLRARNSAWGIRDTQQVLDCAAASGLSLATRHRMPANNLLLVLRAA